MSINLLLCLLQRTVKERTTLPEQDEDIEIEAEEEEEGERGEREGKNEDPALLVQGNTQKIILRYSC